MHECDRFILDFFKKIVGDKQNWGQNNRIVLFSALQFVRWDVIGRTAVTGFSAAFLGFSLRTMSTTFPTTVSNLASSKQSILRWSTWKLVTRTTGKVRKLQLKMQVRIARKSRRLKMMILRCRVWWVFTSRFRLGIPSGGQCSLPPKTWSVWSRLWIRAAFERVLWSRSYRTRACRFPTSFRGVMWTRCAAVSRFRP